MNNNRYAAIAHFAAFLAVLVALSACTPTNKVFTRKDSAPSVRVDPSKIKDAIPREGAITRAGNKNPYTVLGKTYHLLPTSDGYKEQGIASWYGTKFQGRPTANGERYNLYAMTAAHRTLPIPAYVKVTNLSNNRTAIVRVNDRGPFHQNRIIDLSYAAAVKLGYAEQGTARVLVEAINPGAPDTAKNALKAGDTKKEGSEHESSNSAVGKNVVDNSAGEVTGDEQFFLQVGAFRRVELANKLRAELLVLTSQDVQVKPSEPEGYYRVQVGPMSELAEVQLVSERLLQLNISQPRLISE